MTNPIINETEKTVTFEMECECDECKGTGLYVGMAERDGAAVICNRCDGRGKVIIKQTYTKFTKRKVRKNVKRVYQTCGGFVISANDVTTKEGITIKFSNAGVDYKDWLNGESPKPIEDLMCPYLHTGQELQSKDVNDLYKTKCSKYLAWGNITSCKCYKDKHLCWKIYNG